MDGGRAPAGVRALTGSMRLRSRGYLRDALVAAAVAPASTTALPAQTVTAVVHVSVVPMDRERVLPDQTVLVRGDTIVALGTAAQVPIPVGATLIDGTGKFLLPGLADLHVHLDPAGVPDSMVAGLLFRLVAQGVTTIRAMAADSVHVALARRVRAGQVVGPAISTTVSTARCRSGSRLPAESALLRCLHGLRAAGYDYLAVAAFDDALVFGLGAPSLDSVVTAAMHAGIQVADSTVPPTSDRFKTMILKPVADASLPDLSLERLYGYEWPGPPTDTVSLNLEASSFATMAAIVAGLGLWTIPALAARDDEGRRASRLILQTLRGLNARFLLGTDFSRAVHPTATVSRELGLLVDAGMAPYRALETGTRGAATFLGVADRRGTIGPGKRADLVLLDGNPLDDIRRVDRPVGVMVRGRWFDRAALDAGLAAHCWPCR